jgi:hypothetical protein
MNKKLFVLLALLLVLSVALVPALADSGSDDVDGVWCYLPTSLEFFEIGDYAGEKTFSSLIETGEWTGTFTGASTDYGTVLFDPTGPKLFIGAVVFDSVEVGGKIGSLELDVNGDTHGPDSEWAGTWIITGGTGDLIDLQGQGAWWGPGYNPQYPEECGVIYYSVSDDGVVEKLHQTIDTIDGLTPTVFKSRNMQRSFKKKLNAVLNKIEREQYQEALTLLENDILAKTDGCAASGAPDGNDWIVDCDAQNQVYVLIMEAINLMDILVP